MQEEYFILTKNYLLVKAFSPFEIHCKEGRTFKFSVMDDLDKYGEYFQIERRDFLYSHSDTTITMCHLTFKGENLDGLEFEERDYYNLVAKEEYYEHKKENVEYEEQNEKDKEEIRSNTSLLKSEFDTHKEDFEKHKTSNTEFENLAKEKYEAHLTDFENYKAQHKIEFDSHKEDFEKHKTENIEAFEKNDKEHEEIRKSLGGGVRSITWQELKDLKDTSTLSIGTWYRITDYNCYLNSEITTIQSGSHQYDILVLATEKTKLNENAFAVSHEGDTYFQYANLEAWELKYSLENDQTLYPWCDTNGKGVVWWLKDEYGNEAYYDFKNVKELRYEITADSSSKFLNFSQIRYFTSQTSLTSCTVDTSNLYYFYTFSTYFTFDGEIKDFTVQDIKNANYYEKTKDYYSWGNNKLLDRNFIGGKTSEFKINCFIMADKNYLTTSDNFGYFYLRFANNVFEGNSSHSNTFNLIYGFWNGTKSDNTKINGIQIFTYSNTFGSNCFYNTFGSNCSYNTFGSYCYSNTFGSYCSYNTFGSNCSYNTFGSSHASGLTSYCRYIIFHDGVWCTNLYTSTSPSVISSGIWYRSGVIAANYTHMQNIEVHSSTGSNYYNGSSWVYTYGTINVGTRNNSYKINVFVNSSGNLTSNTVGY